MYEHRVATWQSIDHLYTLQNLNVPYGPCQPQNNRVFKNLPKSAKGRGGKQMRTLVIKVDNTNTHQVCIRTTHPGCRRRSALEAACRWMLRRQTWCRPPCRESTASYRPWVPAGWCSPGYNPGRHMSGPTRCCCTLAHCPCPVHNQSVISDWNNFL